jgi:hypothetical protein
MADQFNDAGFEDARDRPDIKERWSDLNGLLQKDQTWPPSLTSTQQQQSAALFTHDLLGGTCAWIVRVIILNTLT